ncbi:hypothetical protein WH96_04490 [Kiloniella spongiae]|uniref:Uncharacterized protein n=2 Tax=Kiloniella spongiae TaxID=1489064 RepID=A0A0H2MGC0_9PROT|nr:hypothetical protein WH96_04490 [Kiloniella spongiae]
MDIASHIANIRIMVSIIKRIRKLITITSTIQPADIITIKRSHTAFIQNLVVKGIINQIIRTDILNTKEIGIIFHATIPSRIISANTIVITESQKDIIM